MSDIIDFDAGAIVRGEATIAECAAQLLELINRGGQRRAASPRPS
jgi:altronate dehydratase